MFTLFPICAISRELKEWECAYILYLKLLKQHEKQLDMTRKNNSWTIIVRYEIKKLMPMKKKVCIVDIKNKFRKKYL
jgi:hypothetical protein